MSRPAPASRRAGVLGSPIAHSLSPALHRAAYAELGLDWSYDAYDVAEAALPGFLAGLDERWVGLSLTMPLKRTVLPLLDEVSPLAALVGGANTVLLGEAGGEGGRRGENTDVPGMVDALREAGTAGGRAVVLGAGATGCSALAALHQLGVGEVVVCVRDPARAGQLLGVADRLGLPVELRPWGLPRAAELVVATTPAGSTDGLADRLPTAVDGVLFDVVYAPWPTRLAAAWARRGGQVVGGLDLLVHQAAHQVELMTAPATGGAPAPLAVMRAAGERALAARVARAAS